MNGIQSIVRQMATYQPRPTTREEMRQRVAELRKTLTQRAVATELGISQSYVLNLHHEHLRLEAQL